MEPEPGWFTKLVDGVIGQAWRSNPQFALVVLAIFTLGCLFLLRFPVLAFLGLLRRKSTEDPALSSLRTDLASSQRCINTYQLVIRDLVYLAGQKSEQPRRTWSSLWGALLPSVAETMTRGPDYACRVIVFTRRGNVATPFFSHGLSAEGAENLKLPVERSVVGDVFKSGEVQYAKDVWKDPRYAKHPKTRHPYRSLACAPIVCDGRVVAALSVDALPTDAFARSDLGNLRSLARLAGFIAEAGQAFAGTDGLEELAILALPASKETAAEGDEHAHEEDHHQRGQGRHDAKASEGQDA